MAPAKTFRTMWDSSLDKRHPCLILDLREKSTSFLPLNLRPLLGWGSVLWFLAAGTYKVMNGYWILSDAFCESIEIMTWLLLLNLMLSLNWVDYVEQTCISRINPHLYCWIWVAKLLFRFFRLLCSWGISVVAFLVFISLWCQYNAGFTGWIGKYFILFHCSQWV